MQYGRVEEYTKEGEREKDQRRAKWRKEESSVAWGR